MAPEEGLQLRTIIGSSTACKPLVARLLPIESTRAGMPTEPMRLLCVYQHAPTRGAPGFYRHRRYFAELVERGWHVDLISCPVDYLTGQIADGYASRLYTREVLDGITHHWIWDT